MLCDVVWKRRMEWWMLLEREEGKAGRERRRMHETLVWGGSAFARSTLLLGSSLSALVMHPAGPSALRAAALVSLCRAFPGHLRPKTLHRFTSTAPRHTTRHVWTRSSRIDWQSCALYAFASHCDYDVPFISTMRSSAIWPIC